MKKFPAVFCLSIALLFSAASTQAQTDGKWEIHDLHRPQPAIVTPGTSSTQDAAGKVPSDAVVLFDGKELSQWLDQNGGPAKWKVENGYTEVVPETGYIHTKAPFGDCQLHVEFSEPVPPKGESQERGNSGVFLMGLYEIQVLDSYENKTYPDGQAAAVYGQYPPLVNASRPPGQWQSYDIVFHAPHFDKSGKLLRPARVTVFHNGVLVQDNVEIRGRTAIGDIPTYVPGPDKAPLALQDHGDLVRYRNIWIRPL
jgi:hypothetical protein